jgi:hypothetical protein
LDDVDNLLTVSKPEGMPASGVWHLTMPNKCRDAKANAVIPQVLTTRCFSLLAGLSQGYVSNVSSLSEALFLYRS